MPSDAPDLSPARLEKLLAAATPGPWHHCQPFHTVRAVRTIHGSVPAQRVDYVSTWPHLGTPKGHRIVVPIEGNPANVRSEDMALIAHAPDLAARVIELEQERDALRLAGKHLALKLAEVYRMGKVSPSECQAMREWIALMPARAALELDA